MANAAEARPAVDDEYVYRRVRPCDRVMRESVMGPYIGPVEVHGQFTVGKEVDGVPIDVGKVKVRYKRKEGCGMSLHPRPVEAKGRFDMEALQTLPQGSMSFYPGDDPEGFEQVLREQGFDMHKETSIVVGSKKTRKEVQVMYVYRVLVSEIGKLVEGGYKLNLNDKEDEPHHTLMPPVDERESTLYAHALSLEFTNVLDQNITDLPWEFAGMMIIAMTEVGDNPPAEGDRDLHRSATLLVKYAPTLSTVDMNLAALGIAADLVKSVFRRFTCIEKTQIVLDVLREIERACEKDELDDVGFLIDKVLVVKLAFDIEPGIGGAPVLDVLRIVDNFVRGVQELAATSPDNDKGIHDAHMRKVF
eukprot:m.155714 g.155714  ORF g.155714 m.155714 type:complete len:361 (+) comp11721_c0_seq32:3806-4888(+)